MEWVHSSLFIISINFNKKWFQSADELVNFNVMSFIVLLFSLAYYLFKFKKLSPEERIIFFLMNFGSVLNTMFLICFTLQHCINGHKVSKYWGEHWKKYFLSVDYFKFQAQDVAYNNNKYFLKREKKMFQKLGVQGLHVIIWIKIFLSRQ